MAWVHVTPARGSGGGLGIEGHVSRVIAHSQQPALVRSGDSVDTPLVTPGPQAGPAHLAVAGAPDDVSLCLHICQDATEARGDDQNLPVTVVQLKNLFLLENIKSISS